VQTHYLVVVSHTMCAHVRCPKNLGNADVSPLWDADVADPLEIHSSIKFRRCMSNRLSVGRGSQKIGGIRDHPLRMWAWLTP